MPENWWFEGEGSGASASLRNGQLVIQAGAGKAHAGTLWLNQQFSGDLEVEFDVLVVSAVEDSNNINLFFLYQSMDDQALYLTRKLRSDGKYRHYTKGELRGIIITFLANGQPERARFRIRAVPPFDPPLAQNYGYHARQGNRYHVVLRKRGSKVQYLVDGEERISADLPDRGLAGSAGYIGFRTWQSTVAWDNLVIRRID